MTSPQPLTMLSDTAADLDLIVDMAVPLCQENLRKVRAGGEAALVRSSYVRPKK